MSSIMEVENFQHNCQQCVPLNVSNRKSWKCMWTCVRLLKVEGKNYDTWQQNLLRIFYGFLHHRTITLVVSFLFYLHDCNEKHVGNFSRLYVKIPYFLLIFVVLRDILSCQFYHYQEYFCTVYTASTIPLKMNNVLFVLADAFFRQPHSYCCHFMANDFLTTSSNVLPTQAYMIWFLLYSNKTTNR